VPDVALVLSGCYSWCCPGVTPGVVRVLFLVLFLVLRLIISSGEFFEVSGQMKISGKTFFLPRFCPVKRETLGAALKSELGNLIYCWMLNAYENSTLPIQT